jgi:hypothetical protein
MTIPAERREWSDTDFDQMGWHDVHIHGISALPDRFELRFDVDYIVEWMCAPSDSGITKFLVAPATLVFENVQHVRIAVNSEQGLLSIDEIRREGCRQLADSKLSIWNWTLRCQEGSVEFEATGYKLALRSSPIVSELQYLNTDQRGRSFDDLLTP